MKKSHECFQPKNNEKKFQRFKGCMQPRVPLELGKLEGEEVVADELVNDVLHKRFKMILTRDLLLSELMQIERLLRNIANMFWIKLLGGEDENNVQFFK